VSEWFAAGPPGRRGQWPVVILAALAGANIVVWGGAWALLRPADPGTVGPAPPPQGLVAPSPVVSEEQVGSLLPVFATAGAVRVRLVSAEPVAIAFHEASYDDAMALRPTGVCGRCRNPTKFTPPHPRDPTLRYLVTHSRGRDTPATSAADLVLSRGTPVLSPVDGTVTRVRRYRLYRAYPDIRIEIRPDTAPRRRVVLIHLGAVPVRRGDRVVASATILGAPRRLPFQSQVDRYVRGRYPHVHLEVKDAAAARQATA
jgi:hypothetical protein